MAVCGLTVDENFFVATRDEEWIQEHIEMLRKAFDEITVTRGDELGIVGMQLRIDRSQECAVLTQPKWESKVIKELESKERLLVRL